MAFLKFNKSELVNLSYSLKREIICANDSGAYSNTSIVACNTRRYHGLLAVTLDRFGGDRFMLLSAIDESILVGGKIFNLGIHRYGDIIEPRGHKYVVDFSADPVPQLTYKVGDIVFRKSLVLDPDKDRIFIKYELLESPAQAEVVIKPFLAFRNIHALTKQNDQVNKYGVEVKNGMAFRMYDNFPSLNIQFNKKPKSYDAQPGWYNNITYSDEMRRGFDCIEDLFVPGSFTVGMKPGDSVILSASTEAGNPAEFIRVFKACLSEASVVKDNHSQLLSCAKSLISNHNGRKKINAGLTWLLTGLLRETLFSITGLCLYGLNDKKMFEEILDNLIADNEERLYRRTTQVEAPLYLASVLQQYIEFGANASAVWKKYGPVLKGMLESYLPGKRSEVSMQPNGLLWSQVNGVALSWMNAYVNGWAVTERPGFQVETNAFWYDAICFAIEMEEKYGPKKNNQFVKEWSSIRDLVKSNFQPTFWNEQKGYLADYVDGYGQNLDVRPNQLFAIWVKHSPIDEELAPFILRVIDNELVTARGIRTLSPRDPKYKGVYEGSQTDRDLAYHQGCAHPALLEQYVEVSFRVKGPSFWKKAEWLVEGIYNDLSKHGVGAFSEIYDGDPPHEPHGAISSSRSTAALLAVEYLMKKNKEA